MNEKTIGSCSLCGGAVRVPRFWWSVCPPTPRCAQCNATPATSSYGPRIEMKPAGTLPKMTRIERYRGTFLAVMALALLAACGATPRDHHMRLNALTSVADPTYAEAVELCDVLRNTIVARPGTTREQDRAAMDEVHSVCDRVVDGFETLRGSQLTARAAIDSDPGGAVMAAIATALALWPTVQALARNVDSLGMGGVR